MKYWHLANLQALSREPPTEFLLFPAGIFSARWEDGSTHSGMWDAIAEKMTLESFASRGRQLAVNWNHSDESPFASIEDKKAAGWFNLESRESGLWMVDIEWTETAAEHIRKKEYRYLSPKWTSDDYGRPTELFNVSLTNDPALLSIRPLAASTEMKGDDVKTIIAALKLPDSATEADVVRTVGELQNTATLSASVLKLTGKTDADQALGIISAWKEDATRVASLSAELAEIKKEQASVRIASLLDTAEADMRISPAEKKALLENEEYLYMRDNPKVLEAHLSNLSKKVASPESPSGAGAERITLRAAIKEAKAANPHLSAVELVKEARRKHPHLRED